MTSALTDRPRPAAPHPPVVPLPAARRRAREPRWVLLVGLLIATLLHGLALWLIQFRLTLVPAPVGPPAQVVTFREATEVIPLVAVPDIDFVEPPPIIEERPEPTALPEPRIEAPAPVRPSLAAPPASIAERLRSTPSDPRLWTQPGDFPPPVNAFDAMLDRVAGRLGAWNDWTAAAALAAANALDWTTTDAEGGRWGVSPGKLHLGSVTVPLPVGFATPPGRREESLARVRGWSAIEAQAAQAEVRETFEDRVKAIRARTDAQRDSTKKSGGDATKKSGGEASGGVRD